MQRVRERDRENGKREVCMHISTVVPYLTLHAVCHGAQIFAFRLVAEYRNSYSSANSGNKTTCDKQQQHQHKRRVCSYEVKRCFVWKFAHERKTLFNNGLVSIYFNGLIFSIFHLPLMLHSTKLPNR